MAESNEEEKVYCDYCGLEIRNPGTPCVARETGECAPKSEITEMFEELLA